ncbi:MAG: helix-turn-helix domain-containing protein [Cytophagales bacterium]|jgi:HTH-type transcriptional regulator/antitoxin HigA|nr:helix-turn-helix domain-containing protein [Cytophagales bacterium]
MKIETNEQYFEVAEKIEGYLHRATAQGGFATLTAEQNAELQALTMAAADYEKQIKLVPTRQPLTLPEMLNLKMFQMHLSQKQLAALLQEPESRISELMKGKRPLTLRLAKKLHKILSIDAGFILETAEWERKNTVSCNASLSASPFVIIGL